MIFKTTCLGIQRAHEGVKVVRIALISGPNERGTARARIVPSIAHRINHPIERLPHGRRKLASR